MLHGKAQIKNNVYNFRFHGKKLVKKLRWYKIHYQKTGKPSYSLKFQTINLTKKKTGKQNHWSH